MWSVSRISMPSRFVTLARRLGRRQRLPIVSTQLHGLGIDGTLSKDPAMRSHQGEEEADVSILRRSLANSSSSAATRFSRADVVIGFSLLRYNYSPAECPSPFSGASLAAASGR
jgi:hypothetical protein